MFSKLLVALVSLSAALPALASPTGYAPTTGDDGYGLPDVYTPDVDSPTTDYPPVDSYNVGSVTGDYADPYPVYDDSHNDDNTHTPTPEAGSNQCNTGTVQCCNTVQDAHSTSVQQVATGNNIDLGSVTGLVGLTCNPVSAIGVSGNSCSSQPVCCTGNNFSGLIVVGCSPININA
ncbi:hydrophobin-domain-containing protein [Pluteus cervinus]|uniref:Hydrophobin-domain-containing protein n=1 Tax=Pluteus cervinus TaxID=181527 RepID=A0ACD3AG35_9AGAR|nr:hydrophobin-domain-containing protein [Pluteus cervinus]